MTQRDIYQRKSYALRRLGLALDRLNRATSTADREKAASWIEIWTTISGIRQFRLSNGGGNGNDGDRG